RRRAERWSSHFVESTSLIPTTVWPPSAFITIAEPCWANSDFSMNLTEELGESSLLSVIQSQSHAPTCGVDVADCPACGNFPNLLFSRRRIFRLQCDSQRHQFGPTLITKLSIN